MLQICWRSVHKSRQNLIHRHRTPETRHVKWFLHSLQRCTLHWRHTIKVASFFLGCNVYSKQCNCYSHQLSMFHVSCVCVCVHTWDPYSKNIAWTLFSVSSCLVRQEDTLSWRWPRDAPNIWESWKLYVSAKSADDCARISTLQSYHYSAVKLFLKYCNLCNHFTW